MQNPHVALAARGEGREVTLQQGRDAVVADDEKAGAVEGRLAMKDVGSVVEIVRIVVGSGGARRASRRNSGLGRG
jgi:hypothetical protein